MALSVLRRRPRHKYAAASLSPCCLHKLRVPGEFAARLDDDAGDGRGCRVPVLLVGPLGKVWRVDLCRPAGCGGGCGGGGGGAAWLGSGWAEFADAHGVGEGWSVVLRCERRGVATVRAFDPACCLASFCTPHAGVGVASKNRPRFIKLLQPEDLEKMKIPDNFVQQHLTGTCPSSQNAMIVSPLGKFWRVKLDRCQLDVLLRDGWARFLTAHDLSEGNILVFRYEGNMVFTIEVFLQNGCLNEYRADAVNLTDDANTPRTAPQQSAKQLVAASVSKKRKNKKANACVAGSEKKQNVSTISAKKVAGEQRKLVDVVPQYSFTKQINSYSLKSFLAVKGTFCSSVGLLGACKITLQTPMKNTRSWSVAFNTANTYGYITGLGWRRFCRDNKVKEGDCCTFNVIETMVWHVVIN